MAFIKGKSGNASGRPKGAKDKKNTDLRAKIQSIINDNIENVQTDLDQLEPMQRLQIIEKLISYCVPKLQAQTIEIDMSNLTDSDLEYIINNINIQENGSETDN